MKNFSLGSMFGAVLVALTIFIGGMVVADAQSGRQSVLVELVNGRLQGRTTQGLFDIASVANKKAAATSVRLPVAAPASASAPCSPGQFAVSANAISVCTAANTWKSAPLGTFTP